MIKQSFNFKKVALGLISISIFANFTHAVESGSQGGEKSDSSSVKSGIAASVAKDSTQDTQIKKLIEQAKAQNVASPAGTNNMVTSPNLAQESPKIPGKYNKHIEAKSPYKNGHTPLMMSQKEIDQLHPIVESSSQMTDEKVVLNFDNADIQLVIKAISQLSGKNFVIDPRVKGTVNIVSDQPISKVDSYKVLASALRMQGFATVEADGVVKVLPEMDAKTYGMKIVDGKQFKNRRGDQVITKIFTINHGSATQISNSLRPLISSNSNVSVYSPSNTLIITDYASNMAKIANLITQLGSNSDSSAKPVLLTLKNAVAADVAQTLQSFLQGGGASAGGGAGGANDAAPVSVVVDPLTNSLIITSLSLERAREIRELAQKLDIDVGISHNQLHVVYLKNADANHVADVLKVVATGQDNSDLKASSDNAKFNAEPSSMFASSGGGGSGGGGGGSVSGLSSSKSSSSKTSSPSGSNTSKDAPKIFIQAEPSTNSLIIQAPDAVYKNLRNVIEMLDVRRAQVMIEAMLASISNTTSGAFGIQWLTGAGNQNGGVIAVSNYAGNGNGLVNLATSVVGAAAGAGAGAAGAAAAGGVPAVPSVGNELYLGLVTGTATVGGQTIPTLGALADMISSTSAGNILSRPTLITMDNEEAKIMVGENIGIPNGSFQNTGNSAGGIVNQVTRQDVGLVLQIKPLITQSGAIRLEVYQENSVVEADQPINSQNGPSFRKQFLRDTLLVDDGQIIALGGMTEDIIATSITGIPGLMDIPYLGWLFSWQSRLHKKTNLVLFLRPVIIRNTDGYKALTNQRYKYIVDQQGDVKAKGNLVLPRINEVDMNNQVPFDNSKIPQNQRPDIVTNLPIVDARASKLKQNGGVTVMPSSDSNMGITVLKGGTINPSNATSGMNTTNTVNSSQGNVKQTSMNDNLPVNKLTPLDDNNSKVLVTSVNK